MTMTRERFAALIEAYGAEPRRWPELEREAALAFAARDAEAQSLLREARALDALLDAAPASAPSDMLHARIKLGLKQNLRAPLFDVRALAALAACAVLGVMVGFGGGFAFDRAPNEEVLMAALFEQPGASAWIGEE